MSLRMFMSCRNHHLNVHLMFISWLCDRMTHNVDESNFLIQSIHVANVPYLQIYLCYVMLYPHIFGVICNKLDPSLAPTSSPTTSVSSADPVLQWTISPTFLDTCISNISTSSRWLSHNEIMSSSRKTDHQLPSSHLSHHDHHQVYPWLI